MILKKSKHTVICFSFICQQCKQDEVLIIIDPTKTYGANFLLCLNGESKYHYLQSEEDGNMQLVENYERDDYEYIPPVPGEWIIVFFLCFNGEKFYHSIYS